MPVVTGFWIGQPSSVSIVPSYNQYRLDLFVIYREIIFPIKEKKDLCGIWTAKTDLAILRIDNDLKVVPIYEASNYPQIACVKKGSALETDKPEQFVFDRLPEFSMRQRGIESCFNDEKLFVPEFLVKKI